MIFSLPAPPSRLHVVPESRTDRSALLDTVPRPAARVGRTLSTGPYRSGLSRHHQRPAPHRLVPPRAVHHDERPEAGVDREACGRTDQGRSGQLAVTTSAAGRSAADKSATRTERDPRPDLGSDFRWRRELHRHRSRCHCSRRPSRTAAIASAPRASAYVQHEAVRQIQRLQRVEAQTRRRMMPGPSR
jgi:hypothetical protein